MNTTSDNFYEFVREADKLKSIYTPPATTLEFASLLDKIDRATGKPARHNLTMLVRS